MSHSTDCPCFKCTRVSHVGGVRMICANTLFGKQETAVRVPFRRDRIPTATSRRSPSRIELVAERAPVDPWTQAERHAELSRLYVNLGIAEAIAERFEQNENQ